MRPTTIGPRRRTSRRVLALAAVLTVVSSAATAAAAGPSHRTRVNTFMFAAQVGSTSSGGSVYAGALVDPKLGHGAVVFSTTGTNTVRVIFHEYFTLGSINGSGHIKLVPGTSGQATLTGSLKISAGTAKYDHAKGKLAVTGTIDSAGMVQATVNGSVAYRTEKP